MVSVILVNYNGFQDTIECVESINNSNNREFRVIVVDNFSTDNSVVILREQQKRLGFILIEAKENNGFSAGNNLGIRKALELGTDYIWLLNNDTIIDSSAIDNLLTGFDQCSSCGVTIGKILYEKQRDMIWYAGGSLNKKTARVQHWHYRESNTKNAGKTQDVTFATGCCIFMKADIINCVGFMDEDYFLYEEDADYSARIIDKGYRIKYIPQAVIYHKVGASTGEASPLSQYYSVRNKYRFIHKCIPRAYRIIAYVYTSLQLLHRIMKKQMNAQIVHKGLQAFFRKEKGKTLVSL